MHLFSKENIWSNPQQFPAYNPVIQTSTIILWTELFPKKRREKIQGENFNLSSNTVVFPHFYKISSNTVYSTSVSTRNPATPSNSTYRINSSTRNTTTTRLIPCHPVQITTRHPPATVPHASKHSTRQNPAIRPLQHKQASSNSRWQKQHSKRQPASTHSLQHLPGKLHRNPLGTTEFYQEK